jgi:CDP-diacylglycerol--serine O-phosphatidyltransferase
MLRYLPNFLTCCNIAFGCLGLVFILDSDLFSASICIFAGMIFDFLDGLAARMLKAYSEIGKQLDSLADMVTFGVLPGVLFYKTYSYWWNTIYTSNAWMHTGGWDYLPILSFLLIVIFSALRLAKFNIDTRQTESFIGLPTPANALVIASLPWLVNASKFWFQSTQTDFVPTIYISLFILSVLLSILMVVEIPLFSLKFKDFTWQNNQIRFIFLILSLLLLGFLQVLALPIIIFLYVLMSLVFWRKPKMEVKN